MLRGDKKLLKSADVGQLEVPRYREYTVAKLYEMCDAVPVAYTYLPKRKPDMKEPHRDFCYKVVAFLYPNFIQQVVRGEI